MQSVTSAPVAHSSPLPDGSSTDKGLDCLQTALTNILGLKPEEYGESRARTKLTWLDEVAELVDPQRNPGAYRICQDAVVARGAVGPLLCVAQRAASDGTRSKALEVLTRLAFGNEPAAASVVAHGEFWPALGAALRGAYPERLGALQLAQALAASPGKEAAAAAPRLAEAAAPLLAETAFAVIPQAALEVLISASFHDAAAVAAVVPTRLLAECVAEDESRPAWLPTGPLQVLTCGLLAVNLLGARGAAHLGVVAQRLDAGSFIEHFVVALEASAGRCSWPAGSSAFHAPARLAETARRLAEAGHSRRLVAAVPPLARAVETSLDDRTTKAALRALRSLTRDVACLDGLLGLEAFREVLEGLAGEEPDASELSCYLAGAESMFGVAQAALDEASAFVKHAPSVRALAEAFAAVCPLDGELTTIDLPKVLRVLPVGPVAAVAASLSGGRTQFFSFQDFAQRVYGTPTILGWWPSLMEDTAALWAAPRRALPGLAGLVAVFEAAAHGASRVGGDALLGEVLPALGLPAEGDVAEEAFAEIMGEDALDLPAFARWLARFSDRLAERLAEEAEAAEDRGELGAEAIAVR